MYFFNDFVKIMVVWKSWERVLQMTANELTKLNHTRRNAHGSEGLAQTYKPL